MDIAALKILTGHIDSFKKLTSTPDTEVAFEAYKTKTEQVILKIFLLIWFNLRFFSYILHGNRSLILRKEIRHVLLYSIQFTFATKPLAIKTTLLLRPLQY